MKKIGKYWPFIIFAVLCVVYYWKVFLKGFLPFPGDLLVGAYLPWLDSQWGYPTGVPVKNPLISDVFSQFYIWKSLISEGWRNLEIPLWNPFSYSGYPMLANFHSGVFYPFNLFHLILGDMRGWSFLVMLPSFASAATMYLYLKQIKVNKIGATIGSVIYAYSGFAISWAQFITAAQAMIWIPVVLLVIEKYFETKRVWYLYTLPLVLFLLITSGHFQIMVYVSILMVVYYLWKTLELRSLKPIWEIIVPGVLSIGLSAFQLLPTLELSSFGLRSEENAIAGHNYGLLPLKNLTTILAPDFFGNPSTYNFFGFFNYHETLFYCGVLAIFTLFLSIFLLRKHKYVRFFMVAVFLAILFGFDTPVGRAVYLYKIPGVSTSDAGRISVIFSFGMAVLAGFVITDLKKLSYKKIIASIGLVAYCFALIFLLLKFRENFLASPTNPMLDLAQRNAVTMRNLILPGLLFAGYSVAFLFARKWKVFTGVLLVMICIEMFRFGWKYIPFVPEKIVYPDTPITLFIKEKSTTELFRIERERAEIMPPATWMQYRFMSASGYDPMTRADYVKVYQEKINGNNSGFISRYSEPERYDSKALGEFNVKYLLVVKRDEVGRIPGENINHAIDLTEWSKVFETEGTAILENSNYLPRARYVDSSEGEVLVTSYTPNTVKVSFQNGSSKALLLADSWYPGWKAFVNSKEVAIEKCEGIFRCVNLDDDSGEVVFDYQPESFWLGLKVSAVSLVLVLIALTRLRKKRS